MTDRKTKRGFSASEDIVGPYKQRVHVTESSGNNPCVWLRVTDLEDLNAAAAGRLTKEIDAAVLLTLPQALELAETLNRFVRNHFLADWKDNE